MRKAALLLLALSAISTVGNSQNAPLSWWGSGLDGSTYQKAVVYVDVTYGLLFDAPKTSTGAKLPIQFNWRGGGTSPLFITPNSNVGMGTDTPVSSLDVRTNGGIITGNGLYFYGSGNATDGKPYARFDEAYGIRFNSPNPAWVFSSKPSVLIGYMPNGTNWGNDNLYVLGKIGIGTTTPDSKLTVKGIIHAEEVKVDLAVPGPDYVFDESYPLRSLEDTKAFIDQNKHLPGIPSSDEMQQNGVNLLEMNMKLLEKVEELTLHLIEQEKRIAESKRLLIQQEAKLNDLENVISTLKPTNR